MKKTIIALMVLAGVASATEAYTGTELNAWLTDALTHRGGSKYTLTFTLTDTFNYSQYSHTIFTLDGTWGIRHQQTKYLGLAVSDDVGSGSYASRSDTTVTMIDTDTAGADSSEMYKGWFYEGSDSDALKGATFTIYSADSNTTITFTTADASRTITLQRDTFYTPGTNFGFKDSGLLNEAIAKSASITFDSGTYTIAPTPAPAVPEPTTATLSLLALAGLAARRRRK
ncbi:MAG: PEP-CTERM sorting domain-containing protein [Bacteroidaceae bacterium]|nr:PEP-CTERM sorting domain-containing protein [Bacteroidaceae bacterium]